MDHFKKKHLTLAGQGLAVGVPSAVNRVVRLQRLLRVHLPRLHPGHARTALEAVQPQPRPDGFDNLLLGGGNNIEIWVGKAISKHLSTTPHPINKARGSILFVHYSVIIITQATFDYNDSYLQSQ